MLIRVKICYVVTLKKLCYAAQMNFSDAIEIADKQRRQSDGALIVDARVARTGIQTYAGFEVGKPEMSVVRVFRPAQEVFSQDTLASFAHRPVTNDHPSAMVTADTWRKSAVVGHTSDEVAAEKIFVRVPLMVSDGAMIADIDNGKRELSAGYTCDLDWTPGTTEAGETYDAVQRNIRINHIAVVRNGRAGSQVRIGDEKPMKTVLIDNVPVQLEPQAAAIIETHMARAADALTAATAKIADAEKKIGQLTADLATAQAQVPTADAINQMVADRVALENRVKQIAPNVQIAPTMNDAAIRRAVVKERFPQLVTDSVSDDQISGMFMTLQPTNDTYRAANGAPVNMPLADNGQSKFVDYLTNAHKNLQ